MPTPELLRCRAPDSISLLYGTDDGIAWSGFLYAVGGHTASGGYTLPRRGSVTGYSILTSVGITRTWTLYKNGVPMSPTPTVETVAPGRTGAGTFQRGQYPVEVGDFIEPFYSGTGGGPATYATVVIEITYDD